MEGSDPNMMDLDADLQLDGAAERAQSDKTQSEKDLDISQEKTPQRTPRPRRALKKRKFSLIDSVISLTDTQLHEMRTNANLILAENAMAMFQAERRRKQEEKIKQIPDLWYSNLPFTLTPTLVK